MDLQEYNEVAYEDFNKNVLCACQHCGRTFSESALKHHSRACTAEKPFKPRNLTGEARNKSVEQASPTHYKKDSVSTKNTVSKSYAPESNTPGKNVFKNVSTKNGNASPKFGQKNLRFAEGPNPNEVDEFASQDPFDRNFSTKDFRGYTDFKKKLTQNVEDSYYAGILEKTESSEEEEESEDSELDIEKYEYEIVSRKDDKEF